MPVKAIFSTNYKAVHSRIRRLPKLMTDHMKASAKRDAKGVIETYKTGIETDSLQLARLRPSTIVSKERKGYSQPTTPLYSEGLDDPRSYVNMLEVVTVGNRMYAVRPKKGRHHADPDRPGDVPPLLKDLFDWHEYGVTITNGFGRGLLLRVPARPALRYAYKLYMARIAKSDPAVEVRSAIVKFVQEGDRAALERIYNRMLKSASR